MKNILVTGGAGFIGSHTVLELYKSGYNPIILDNFSNSEKFIIDNLEDLVDRKIILAEADCCDSSAMDNLFLQHKFSGVIHFAAFKAVGESISNAVKYHKNNVNSTTVLLDTMKKHSVRNLVFSSSCTVYGDPDETPVSENSKKNPPTSPYGNTKVYCETAITDVFNESESILSSIMLRYFNPIGADPSGKIGELPLGAPNNLIPYITQTAAGLRDELTIFGDDYPTIDGTCVRDYIHVSDVARAHVSALNWIINHEKTLEAINLGSGQGNSVMEVVKTFEEVSGGALKYKIGARRPGDVAEVWADPAKAKKMLGWQAEKTLRDAIQDAWKWQKNLST